MRVLCLSLTLWLAACGECESDYDCDGTRVCDTESGECQAFSCKRASDCPPGQACSTNRCVERKPSQAPPDAPDALVLVPAATPPD